jgi:hypothetical protein
MGADRVALGAIIAGSVIEAGSTKGMRCLGFPDCVASVLVTDSIAISFVFDLNSQPNQVAPLFWTGSYSTLMPAIRSIKRTVAM